jgi:hypothetical protein
MKFSRSVLAVMLAVTIALVFAQTAAAQRGGKGNGGKGATAAVGIEAIHMTNQANGDVITEISGGGFLGGSQPSVTLDDGTALSVDEVSQSMILATIPAGTPDGDYTLTVTTGDQSKQTASADLSLGGTLTVACIDWFRSGPKDEHVHTEVHVEDQYGNAVIGAVVTWTAENDSTGIYQTNVSATGDVDGHANGAGCVDPTGSGVTDWFCCIGAGKWDNEVPPGKRACNSGFYTADIVDVAPPPSTNMVWDGSTPDNGIVLDNQQP